jgi:phosphatidylglycerophosphate synthase
MEVKERFLRKLAKPLENIFYNLGIPPSFLVIVRFLFAIVTLYVIVFAPLFVSFLFVLLYQFLFLFDYVDGNLARRRKEFKESWNYFDFFMHYVFSILFISAISLRIFFDNGNIFFMVLGFFAGFILLLNSLSTKDYFFLIRHNKLFPRKEGKKRGFLIRTVHSFTRIEEPFGFLFIFVTLQFLFYPEINFYIIFVILYFSIGLISLIYRVSINLNNLE